jgi:hypothetical protein
MGNESNGDRSEWQQRNPAREARARALVGEAQSTGALRGNGHSLRTSLTSPEVWVYRDGGQLVAYSSTVIDRLSSIEEFVSDYFA